MDKQLINKAHQWIEEANSIVITAHKSPDGDSVGSSTALLAYLKKLGKNAKICFPDEIPFFLNWMQGANEILTYAEEKNTVTEQFNQADLVFCLDYNSASRVGDMQTILTQCEANKIMIDHHENPDNDFCDIVISHPDVCSTAQLIFEFIDGAGNKSLIDKNLGQSIYCGIMTDTGSFRFPSTNSKTHRIIADLMDAGVINNEVHEQVFDTNTVDRLKLRAHIMSNSLQLIQNNQVAIISVSQFELNDLNYIKGDTEGLVNQALSIHGVKVAVFFKEQDGIIKISFRSKGNVFVNEFAGEFFKGGGHKYASGGRFNGKLSDAIDRFVTLSDKLVS